MPVHGSAGRQVKAVPASEVKTTGFTAAFQAPAQLAAQYADFQELKEEGGGAESSGVKKLDPQIYMDAYRNAPKPPAAGAFDKQEILSEFRRGAPHNVEANAEKDPEERGGKREAFLRGRKVRHDDAVEEFDK